MKTHNTTKRRVGLALNLTLLAATLPVGMGCQLFNEKLTADPGPVYPQDAMMVEVLDVQLFRDITVLRFTNTSTTDFPAGTMWLNKRYSAPIPAIASGETVEIDLKQFVDEFGDTYSAGGFFAQREPTPVVLAQIEVPSIEGVPVLYGLVVVQNKFD